MIARAKAKAKQTEGPGVSVLHEASLTACPGMLCSLPMSNFTAQRCFFGGSGAGLRRSLLGAMPQLLWSRPSGT